MTGAVLYAVDLPRLTAFYGAVLGFAPIAGDGSHQVLAGSTGQAFQLVVHAIPAHVAATLVVSAPPERREDTPIKLFFTVDDLAAATAVIRQLGGDVAPRGWRGPGFSALDAHDPEGNVFQLRERVAAP